MQQTQLVIDARMVGPEGHGISLYVQDLIAGLAERQLTYRVTILISRGTETIFSALTPAINKFSLHTCQNKFLSPSEWWEIPAILRALKADLYFSPSFASPFPGLSLPCPYIQCAHDLNHLHFGSMAQKIYYQFLLKPSLRRAKKITTVSEFSRQEIASWLGIAPQKIALISNAVNIPAASPNQIDCSENFNDDSPVEKKYFLAITSQKPHKNLPFLIEAYTEYRSEAEKNSIPLPLLITTHLTAPPAGVSCIKPANTKILWQYLRGAKALFFPSLYEGFGRPPLEAALAGIPVVASAIMPHKEALANFPSQLKNLLPLELTAWSKAFARAADGQLLAPLVTERENATQAFSLKKLADAYDEIFRSEMKIR